MKLLFFEEELLLPDMDVENKIYTKEMVADLSEKKIGVILGNNGYATMMKSLQKAIKEDYYCIITNQITLLNNECFIDKDGIRDIYISSLKKNMPLTFIEDYLGIEIHKDDNLEFVYRNKVDEEINK